MPIALSSEEDSKSVLQRVKLSELYILHVLPRVGEWEYAREFTQLSPDIDEEQKEVYLSLSRSLLISATTHSANWFIVVLFNPRKFTKG